MEKQPKWEGNEKKKTRMVQDEEYWHELEMTNL